MAPDSRNNSNGETRSLLPKTTNDGDANSARRGCCWILRSPVGLVGLLVILLFLARVAVVVFWSKTDDTTKSSMTSNEDEQTWWEEQHHVDTTTVVLQGELDAAIANGGDLRWGIIGLGRIARDFATALKMSKSNLTAVAAGSLPDSLERARDFARSYNVAHYYGTYEELANDPNVDIVYIATTNQLHLNNTLLMLRHGKNVLLEKPMALNAREAHLMAEQTRSQERLLLTNFWTRFFPVAKAIRFSLLENVGPLMAMKGDFGFPAWPDPHSRLLNKSLGGGSMLDLGCYLVNMVLMIVSSATNSTRLLYPTNISAAMAQTNYMGADYEVDTEMAFSLEWNDETLSMIMSGQTSFRRPSSFEVELQGTLGRIVIHGPANAPHAATIYEHDPYGPLKHVQEIRTKNEPIFDSTHYGPEQYPESAGFVYVIQDVEKCMNEKGIPGRPSTIGGGCLELEDLTMDEQLATVEISDDVMRKAGLVV